MYNKTVLIIVYKMCQYDTSCTKYKRSIYSLLKHKRSAAFHQSIRKPSRFFFFLVSFYDPRRRLQKWRRINKSEGMTVIPSKHWRGNLVKLRELDTGYGSEVHLLQREALSD